VDSVSPLGAPRGDGPDERWFEDFYREYVPRVRGHILAHFRSCDPDEVAHETMVRCYARYDEIDPDRDAWPYVCRIASNYAKDLLRKSKPVMSVYDLPDVPDDEEDQPYKTTLDRDRRAMVEVAMGRMKPAQRELLKAHYLEEISSIDLAAMHDIAPNTMRQQIHRAGKQLARQVRRLGGPFGVAGLAVHDRLSRAARRVNEYSIAGGSAVSSCAAAATVTFAISVVSALGGTAAHAAVRPVALDARKAAARPTLTTRLSPDPVAAASETRRPPQSAVTESTSGSTSPQHLVLIQGDPVRHPDERTEIPGQPYHNPVTGNDGVIGQVWFNYTPGYHTVCDPIQLCPDLSKTPLPGL
jgi:RNA polymerase sigma-70 factor (ECF subfamily)